MQALVLAAGVGSRLKPYTDNCPKPMLPVAGQPILAYNLAMLAAAGFTEIVINLHYLPDVVKTFVGNGERWGLNVTYSEEHELLGTAGALGPTIERFRGGTFAIVYGDNINDLSLTAMLHFHRANASEVTIALAYRDDVQHSGVAEMRSDGRIERFVEKPRAGETSSHMINAGVLIAEPSLLSALPDFVPSDLARDVIPRFIAGGHPVFGFVMSGRHWWFDRVSDYLAANSEPALNELALERDFGNDRTAHDVIPE
jgi:NDP-sugar pyrophosphorylase family protein